MAHVLDIKKKFSEFVSYREGLEKSLRDTTDIFVATRSIGDHFFPQDSKYKNEGGSLCQSRVVSMYMKPAEPVHTEHLLQLLFILHTARGTTLNQYKPIVLVN